MEVVRLCLTSFQPHQKVRLLPFIMTTTFYLVQPYPHNCLIGVIFKILPMLSLISYVIMTQSHVPSQTRRFSLDTLVPRDAYSSYILFGLVISMVADVLVTMRYVALLGVGCFVVAHVLYVIGINESGVHKGYNSSMTSLFVLLFLDMFLFLEPSIDGYMWKIVLFLYFIPLFLAAWKATSALKERPGSKATTFACIGALSFVVSDVLIVMYHTGYTIPLGKHLYMLTYYIAQFGWTVSTSDLRNDRAMKYRVH